MIVNLINRKDTPREAGAPPNVVIVTHTLTLHPHPPEINITHFRGAIANAFIGCDLFHQHEGDKLAYRYPLVQYRVTSGGNVQIAAINEAANLLAAHPLKRRTLAVGPHRCIIADCSVAEHSGVLRQTTQPVRYAIETPLLPFNQHNYAAWRRLDPVGKCRELNRLIVAHLLRLCKGFNYWVPAPLTAHIAHNGPAICEQKEQTLVGFTGTIETNLSIPCSLAIGKAVSHGYGVLRKI